MDSNNVVSSTQTKLSQVVDRFTDNLKSLGTGRANAAILDNVVIEAYGSQMPLKQAASIVVPEAQLIQITPFDPNNLSAISNAIRNDVSLGLNPSDDGRVVRVLIPALNEERRRDLAKQIGTRQEETMVTVRGVRHDAIDTIDKAKKAKQIGEDEAKRLSNQIEEIINKVKSSVEETAKAKETEIMTM